MYNENPHPTEIVLPLGSNLVVRNGSIRISFDFNAQNGVDVYSNAPVSVYCDADETQPLVRVPQIGEEVANGWKYGGVSASTNLPLFVAPKDEPLKKIWQTALDDAAALRDFYGHNGSRQQTESDLVASLNAGNHDHGVRLPTSKESNDNLYKNRALIGGFNTSAEYDYYWTSTEYGNDCARFQRFSDGNQIGFHKNNVLAVRYVRS